MHSKEREREGTFTRHSSTDEFMISQSTSTLFYILQSSLCQQSSIENRNFHTDRKIVKGQDLCSQTIVNNEISMNDASASDATTQLDKQFVAQVSSKRIIYNGKAQLLEYITVSFRRPFNLRGTTTKTRGYIHWKGSTIHSEFINTVGKDTSRLRDWDRGRILLN